jgi:hypothetical protein
LPFDTTDVLSLPAPKAGASGRACGWPLPMRPLAGRTPESVPLSHAGPPDFGERMTGVLSGKPGISSGEARATGGASAGSSGCGGRRLTDRRAGADPVGGWATATVTVTPIPTIPTSPMMTRMIALLAIPTHSAPRRG